MTKLVLAPLKTHKADRAANLRCTMFGCGSSGGLARLTCHFIRLLPPAAKAA